MTPQEENIRIQQQVNEELRAYMEAQRAATAETEKSAAVEAKVASLTATGLQILEKLYAAQLRYTIAMAEGKNGAAVFNDSIDAMAEATQIATVALSLLVPGGPLIKGLVAGFTFLATQSIKTAAEMQKAANLQADATYKAFSAFSKAGATGADGLRGLFTDVQSMRLNVRELDQLAGALANSAQEMAGMGGTVFKARGQFADLNRGLREYEQGFLRLGLSNAETAEASLGFMKMQNTLTGGQQRDYGKLSGAAKKYLEEQEALTRATGFNRKQQEAAQEKFMSQERFGAKIAQLNRDGQTEVAKQLIADMTKAAAVSDEFGQAFADSVTGMYTSEASVKGLTSTQNAIMEHINNTLDRRITNEEQSNASFQGIFAKMKETQEMFGDSQMAGVTEGFLFNMKTFQRGIQLANNGFDTQMKESKTEVEKLMGTISGVDEQLTRFSRDVLQKQIDQMVKEQAELNGKFSTEVAGPTGWVDMMISAMKTLTGWILSVVDVLKPLSEGLGVFFFEALNSVGKLLTGDLTGAIHALGRGSEALTDGFLETNRIFGEAIWEYMKTFAQGLMKSIQEITGPLGPVFENIGKTISGFGDSITGLGESVKTGLAGFNNALVDMVAKLWERLSALIPGFNTAVEYAQTGANAVKNAGDSVVNFVSSVFGGETAPASAPQGSKPPASAPQGSKPPASAPQGSKPPASAPQGSKPPASAPQGSKPPAPPVNLPYTSGPPGPVQSAPAQSAQPVTTYSDSLLNFIKSTERFTPTAFWDSQQWTNGYGTKAMSPMSASRDDSGPKETINEPTAFTRMTDFLQNAVSSVITFGKKNGYNWNQGQVDALTSFSYNAGLGILNQLTNGGKRSNEEIAAKILEYNKAKNNKTGEREVLPGLVKRRQEELSMFQAKEGGVFDGPKSGYAATLHGMEAVIPLKDGAVPVSMSQEFNMTATNLGELVNIMKNNVDMQATMLSVLDEIRRVQTTTADNTGKMVAYASN